MNSSRLRSSSCGARLLATLALATLGAAACERAPLAGSPTLATTTIPPGNTFAMAQPISLELTAAKGALWQRNARVSVGLSDGTILFQGPLGEAHPVKLKLSVPNKDKVLIATLTSDARAPVTVTLPIASGSATHSFQ